MYLVAFLSPGKAQQARRPGRTLLPPHDRTDESAAGFDLSTSVAETLVSDQLGLL